MLEMKQSSKKLQQKKWGKVEYYIMKTSSVKYNNFKSTLMQLRCPAIDVCFLEKINAHFHVKVVPSTCHPLVFAYFVGT